MNLETLGSTCSVPPLPLWERERAAIAETLCECFYPCESDSRIRRRKLDDEVCTACIGEPACDRGDRVRAGRTIESKSRCAPAVVVGAGVHRAGQGLFP